MCKAYALETKAEKNYYWRLFVIYLKVIMSGM